jgi:hypothetical protein
MEYRTFLSPFYVRIHRLENRMHGIAVNDRNYTAMRTQRKLEF